MAIEIKTETLKEIAEYLAMGMVCFYHKTNCQLVYFPDELESSGYEEEWADETGKIEAAPDDYFEFEKMGSHESFKVMERFISDNISHIPTHNKFIDAISRKKSRLLILITSFLTIPIFGKNGLRIKIKLILSL